MRVLKLLQVFENYLIGNAEAEYPLYCFQTLIVKTLTPKI